MLKARVALQGNGDRERREGRALLMHTAGDGDKAGGDAIKTHLFTRVQRYKIGPSGAATGSVGGSGARMRWHRQKE